MFVALDLPSDAKAECTRLVQELRPRAPEARFVPSQNLHLTIAFLGDVPPGKVEAITSAITDAAATHTVSGSHLQSVGAFPSAGRARVLWAGLTEAGELERLAQSIALSLEPLGFQPEERSFSAHITLGRLRKPEPVDLIGLEVVAVPIPVESLTLFRSHLGSGPARYEPVAVVPLGMTGSRRSSGTA